MAGMELSELPKASALKLNKVALCIRSPFNSQVSAPRRFPSCLTVRISWWRGHEVTNCRMLSPDVYYVTVHATVSMPCVVKWNYTKKIKLQERFQAHKEQWDVICYIIYVQTETKKTLQLCVVEHVVRRGHRCCIMQVARWRFTGLVAKIEPI